MLALGILLAVVGIILFRGAFKSKKLAGDALKDQAKKGVLALTACANLTGMLTSCFGVSKGQGKYAHQNLRVAASERLNGNSLNGFDIKNVGAKAPTFLKSRNSTSCLR